MKVYNKDKNLDLSFLSDSEKDNNYISSSSLFLPKNDMEPSNLPIHTKQPGSDNLIIEDFSFISSEEFENHFENSDFNSSNNFDNYLKLLSKKNISEDKSFNSSQFFRKMGCWLYNLQAFQNIYNKDANKLKDLVQIEYTPSPLWILGTGYIFEGNDPVSFPMDFEFYNPIYHKKSMSDNLDSSICQNSDYVVLEKQKKTSLPTKKLKNISKPKKSSRSTSKLIPSKKTLSKANDKIDSYNMIELPVKSDPESIDSEMLSSFQIIEKQKSAIKKRLGENFDKWGDQYSNMYETFKSIQNKSLSKRKSKGRTSSSRKSSISKNIPSFDLSNKDPHYDVSPLFLNPNLSPANKNIRHKYLLDDIQISRTEFDSTINKLNNIKINPSDKSYTSETEKNDEFVLLDKSLSEYSSTEDNSTKPINPKSKANSSTPNTHLKNKTNTSIPNIPPKIKANSSNPNTRPKSKANSSNPNTRPKSKAYSINPNNRSKDVPPTPTESYTLVNSADNPSTPKPELPLKQSSLLKSVSPTSPTRKSRLLNRDPDISHIKYDAPNCSLIKIDGDSKKNAIFTKANEKDILNILRMYEKLSKSDTPEICRRIKKTWEIPNFQTFLSISSISKWATKRGWKISQISSFGYITFYKEQLSYNQSKSLDDSKSKPNWLKNLSFMLHISITEEPNPNIISNLESAPALKICDSKTNINFIATVYAQPSSWTTAMKKSFYQDSNCNIKLNSTLKKILLSFQNYFWPQSTNGSSKHELNYESKSILSSINNISISQDSMESKLVGKDDLSTSDEAEPAYKPIKDHPSTTTNTDNILADYTIVKNDSYSSDFASPSDSYLIEDCDNTSNDTIVKSLLKCLDNNNTSPFISDKNLFSNLKSPFFNFEVKNVEKKYERLVKRLGPEYSIEFAENIKAISNPKLNNKDYYSKPLPRAFISERDISTISDNEYVTPGLGPYLDNKPTDNDFISHRPRKNIPISNIFGETIINREINSLNVKYPILSWFSCISYNQHTLIQALLAVKSRFYFQYRKNYKNIASSKISSDIGWGCVHRSSQMLLSEAFMRVLPIRHPSALGGTFSRSFPPQFNDPKPSPYLSSLWYQRILEWFTDEDNVSSNDSLKESSGFYSLHSFSRAGLIFNKQVGDWFSPGTAANVIKILAQAHGQECPLSVYVCNDQLIIDSDFRKKAKTKINDISKLYNSKLDNSSNHNTWVPALLLVPVRLGIEKVNPVYYDKIKKLFKNPYSLGFVGGSPGKSFFFIGSQDNNLLYLDPHFPKPYVSLDEYKKNKEVAEVGKTSTSYNNRNLIKTSREIISQSDSSELSMSDIGSSYRVVNKNYPKGSKKYSFSSKSVNTHLLNEPNSNDRCSISKEHFYNPDTSVLNFMDTHSSKIISDEFEDAINDDFHTVNLRSIPIQDLDPSMFLAFIFKTEECWDNFIAEERHTVKKSVYNLTCSIDQIFKNKDPLNSSAELSSSSSNSNSSHLSTGGLCSGKNPLFSISI
ncbi:Cysteine protease ATG4A [Smittium culicis]|uniref:Autophagy-related protein 4 n=1 Tax=Smittium culicis TaxID=133412 RepID=A0A1R1YG91_9FUNG|nr:Cysteine protease ATG4A [Smittium culicis]